MTTIKYDLIKQLVNGYHLSDNDLVELKELLDNLNRFYAQRVKTDCKHRNTRWLDCEDCKSKGKTCEEYICCDCGESIDINDAENPLRQKAIKILESIAEKMGNPDLFDSLHRATPNEPDGTWYEYEDLVTNLLAEK